MKTTPPTTKPLFHLDHVSFCFGHAEVLKNITFDVFPGEFLGLIGPNGSGKTTLLKLMLGLLHPHTGSIELAGQPVKLGQYGLKVGYVPQKVTQSETRFPMTVAEVVGLGRVTRRGWGRPLTAEDKRLVHNSLETVGLASSAHAQLSELSGGQQQRVFIAQALAGQPELLMLDEPTVGIDHESQEEFYRLLTQLNHDHKLTIILVSHDLEVITHAATSLACLNQTLVYHGAAQKFAPDDYLESVYGKHKKWVAHTH